MFLYPKTSRSLSGGFRGKWNATTIHSYYVICKLKFYLDTLAVEYLQQNPVEEGIQFMQDKHWSLNGVEVSKGRKSVPERSRRAASLYFMPLRKECWTVSLLFGRVEYHAMQSSGSKGSECGSKTAGMHVSQPMDIGVC